MNSQDIKHLRLRLGETQTQFAARFGISQRHVNYLEQGEREAGPTLRKNLEDLLVEMRNFKKNKRLKKLCTRLVWWEKPEAVENAYLLKKIMDYGTWDDWKQAGEEYLENDFRLALRTAKVGDFSLKSWNFWHLKLKMKKTSLLTERILA